MQTSPIVFRRAGVFTVVAVAAARRCLGRFIASGSAVRTPASGVWDFHPEPGRR